MSSADILGAMKLSDFLTRNGISPAAFAARIGVCEAKSVYRYLRGERIPAPEIMARIWTESGGAVGPADFHELPPLNIAPAGKETVNGDAA